MSWGSHCAIVPAEGGVSSACSADLAIVVDMSRLAGRSASAAQEKYRELRLYGPYLPVVQIGLDLAAVGD